MKDLSELLADPETHEPVTRATDAQLVALREAMKRGRARVREGELPRTVDGAYISNGGRWVYPDALGMPSFIVEERIELDEPL